MTPKGAGMVIDDIDLRIFDIEGHIERLFAEKQKLLARRQELVTIQNRIEPTAIIICK